MAGYTPFVQLPSITELRYDVQDDLNKIKHILEVYHTHMTLSLPTDTRHEEWVAENILHIIESNDKVCVAVFLLDEILALIKISDDIDPHILFIRSYVPHYSTKTKTIPDILDAHEKFDRYKISLLADSYLTPKDKLLLFLCHPAVTVERILDIASIN